MKPLLDATAGNRMIWAHVGKKSDYVVFMDKEPNLAIPPDVLAVWGHLPFRDQVFSCVIFDPPHSRFGKNSMHQDTKGHRWWGNLSKRWQTDFYKAAQEFIRVSDILCFKWNETSHVIDKILPLFRPWKIKYMKKHQSSMKRGKSTTWWVTFINEVRI